MDIQDRLDNLHSLCMRVNTETELHAWYEIHGHVDKLDIKVKAELGNYRYEKVTSHEISYKKRDYQEQEDFEKRFLESTDIAIKDLNNIISKTWTSKYTAYCNLIDMSCSEVFSSEDAAKKWVRKMKRKYNKVGAIVGINEEKVGV